MTVDRTQPKTCPVCSKSFYMRPIGAVPKYCSRVCNSLAQSRARKGKPVQSPPATDLSAYARARRRQERRALGDAEKATALCTICGTPDIRRGGKYCKPCADRADRASKRLWARRNLSSTKHPLRRLPEPRPVRANHAKCETCPLFQNCTQRIALQLWTACEREYLEHPHYRQRLLEMDDDEWTKAEVLLSVYLDTGGKIEGARR